jgi:hypothetical protein
MAARAPPRFLEQEVGEVLARFAFGVVVLVGLGRSRLLCLRYFHTQALQFIIKRRLVGKQRREAFVLLTQTRFQRLQLLGGLRRGSHRPGNCRRIECDSGIRSLGACIGASEPVSHMGTVRAPQSAHPPPESNDGYARRDYRAY